MKTGIFIPKKMGRRLHYLLKNSFFWTITLLGLVLIGFSATTMYLIEGPNQIDKSLLDFLVWTVGLVTTVGYGDITAQTALGKMVVMGMMLFGSLYLWSYMAILVTALIEPEITNIDREVHNLESEINEMEGELKEMKAELSQKKKGN